MFYENKNFFRNETKTTTFKNPKSIVTSKMAKVVFYEIEEWEKDYVRERMPGYELEFHEEKLDQNNSVTARNADAVAVFIYSEITKELLYKLPDLKLIATMSTGFDHIDINGGKRQERPCFKCSFLRRKHGCRAYLCFNIILITKYP